VYFSEVWPLLCIIVGSLICIDSTDYVAFVNETGYKRQNYVLTAGQRLNVTVTCREEEHITLFIANSL